MSMIPNLAGNRRAAPSSGQDASGGEFTSVNPFFFPSWDSIAFVNMRIDWKETNEEHMFEADVPGMTKDDIKVEADEDDRVLLISGERKLVEEEDKNHTWHKAERSGGKFTRKFRLPENAKMDQVKAAMEHGVLKVTVPKAEVKKRPVKAIHISG